MKVRNAFFLLIMTVLLSASLEGSPDPVQSENEPQTLKDRQVFNQKKRSTRNIYKVTMRSGISYRLQTAVGYFSTIDLPEEALKVFVGDQEQFKTEVYERQVIIKPLTDEADAKTNLLIVTKSGRLSFDVSVGPPETADFVLDFRLPQDDSVLVENAFQRKVTEKTEQLETEYKAKAEKLDERAEKLASDKLKEQIASAVENLSLKASAVKDKIQLNLLSLSKVGEKNYLRFSILNYSESAYRPLKVIVGAVPYERKLLGKKPAGLIEFQSELTLAENIQPDSYVYGVVSFESRLLQKNERPIFRIFEETKNGSLTGRNLEIKDFEWFK